MGRLILILAALILLPSVLWFGWRWLKERRPQTAPAAPQRWQDAPWMWLVLTGLALAVAATLAFGALDPQDCKPVPTQIIDGKLVPAHCE